MTKLIIRSKSFEQWMKANFDRDTLREIAEHGADAGWPNLSYYTDTVKIYNHFRDEIHEAIAQDADDMGYKNAAALVAECSRDYDIMADYDHFANWMTWYMAERTARQITDN